MIDLLLVAGARPNFMKVAPLHWALTAFGRFRIGFVHTGQHYDRDMSDVFLEELRLPTPDFELGVGIGTNAQQTAEVMLRFEPVLVKLQAAVVVVVGDVNSTLGAALTAVKLGVPVAHVEAGLRSFDRTMPEEVNRVVTDVVSDYLFTPSQDGVDNLLREGIAEEKIHLVGNVMIDTLEALLPAIRKSEVLERLGLDRGGYLLVTLHRPSNVDNESALRRLADLLTRLAAVIRPVLVAHPRTRKQLTRMRLVSQLSDSGVMVLKPAGYIDFVALEEASAAVLTDSGGVQEETTVLGVPCLTLRAGTERPITVTDGTNRVIGTDPDAAFAAVEDALAGERPHPQRPPLWDGHAAERIAEVLSSIVASKPARFSVEQPQ